MHQFVRVEQGNGVIPALVSDTGLRDLRSLISDITPDTIASGILTKVNTATLKPLFATNDTRFKDLRLQF
jgi:hypothetical protein